VALATAQSAFPELSAGPPSGLPLAPGMSVARYVGDHSAQLSGPGGRGAAVISSLPLIGTTPSGAKAPVDLGLESVAGGFAPHSAGVPVVLPSSATGTLSFPSQGFGLRMVGALDAPGRLSHDRVWFGDVEGQAASVDALVNADRAGAEVSYVIRSASSPEDQRLAFELPAGARLSLNGDRPGEQTVSVLGADGATLGVVLPPVSADASGKRVPSSYSLEGADRLVIHVAHREGSYLYPLVADPLVASWDPGMCSSWSFQNVGGVFSGGCDAQSYTYSQGPGTIGQGANGQYADWIYGSLPGAYIYEQYAYLVYHFPNNSEEFGGIANNTQGWVPGTWKDTCDRWQTPCSGSPGGPAGPSANRFQGAQEQNIDSDSCASGTAGACSPPAHGVVLADNRSQLAGAFLTGAVGAGYIPKAAVYGAWVYESDDIVPSISGSLSGYPAAWAQNPTGTASTTGSVTTGLGMDYITLLNNGNYSSQSYNSCSGYPCPFTQNATFSPTINQGLNPFTATATNRGGNTSGAATLTGTNVCKDAVKPVVNTSGTLANPPGGIVLPGTNTLNVSATDGIADGVAGDQQSGVQGITTTITPINNPQQIKYHNQTSPSGGTIVTCMGNQNVPADASAGQPNTVDTSQWLPGAYTETISVPDNVGNVTTLTQTLNVVGQDNLVSTVQGIVNGVAYVNPTPGSYSNSCTSPTAQVVDGYAGSTYVTMKVQPNPSNSSQKWVCYRASNGPNSSVNVGGRVDVANTASVPSIDSSSGACATQGYVAPPLSGSLAGTSFLVGASNPSGAAWVCLQFGSTVQYRVVVPTTGVSGPPVTVNQDSSLPLPSPTADPYPSGTCENGTNPAPTQLANLGSADSTQLWAYEWRPNSSTIDLCARVQGPVSAGGMASVTTTPSGGVQPVFGSDSNVSLCTVPVITLTSPVAVSLNLGPAGNPQSVCVGPTATSGTRYYVGTSGSGVPPYVTWTPDPGTP
jgi:hypothetical protein